MVRRIWSNRSSWLVLFEIVPKNWLWDPATIGSRLIGLIKVQIADSHYLSIDTIHHAALQELFSIFTASECCSLSTDQQMPDAADRIHVRQSQQSQCLQLALGYGYRGTRSSKTRLERAIPHIAVRMKHLHCHKSPCRYFPILCQSNHNLRLFKLRHLCFSCCDEVYSH